MSDAPEEKRRGPRRRVLKGAIVAYNDRRSTMPCSVRDTSDTGQAWNLRETEAAVHVLISCGKRGYFERLQPADEAKRRVGLEGVACLPRARPD